MNDLIRLKLLFIINPRSGNNDTDWETVIEEYFQNSGHTLELLLLGEQIDLEEIRDKIGEFKPDRVVAVGGDGTIKLAAECLIHTDIWLGIIPAGSANGLAKELNIPADVTKALDVVVNGSKKTIHITRVNDQICIHLSDIGFNAFVIKKFETGAHRGMLGYVKAAWKVLWQQPMMRVDIKIDEQLVKQRAAMVVIANATKYGSGACINPEGKLDDDVFEVVVVKTVSILEIFKMMVTHMPFDDKKTEVFQVRSLEIESKRKAHFQMDGEYLGKVNSVKATIDPAALHIIVPAE
ncbi:MAG TPA: YegS/Rv2252/BmrU family lipid kinase [Chitinophagaceae bacterium]|jgi:YegS/Rv2252/BmrU family lipid kinase|nr:YegS/Rv2252/BmrU family lipid kinase [Chitinophagaceae bacterium]